MLGTEDEMLAQFRAGKDSTAEFKEVRLAGNRVLAPDAEDLAADLVAFANTEGGSVFLGVDDSGAVRGIPQDLLDAVESWAVAIAADKCEPPLRPLVRRVVLPSRTSVDVHVLEVALPRALYLHRTSDGRYYDRRDSARRELTPADRARIFQQRIRKSSCDVYPVPAAEVSDLSTHLLEAAFRRSTGITWMELLRGTGVALPDERGVERPSVAGLLTFGTEPTDFLPFACIQAVCYRGNRPSSYDVMRVLRLDGPVFAQIEDGISFVERCMRPEARMRSSNGGDLKYDLEVVHEAIVNAVAHRDYSMSGSKIRLLLFADRLELYSPGKLPGTVTLANMASCTCARNPILAAMLSKIRSTRFGRVFVESRGKGVSKILKGGKSHSGRSPRYELIGEELRLTIWARGASEAGQR